MINQIIKDYLSITELDNLKYSKALIFFQTPKNSVRYIKLINEFYDYQLKNHTLNKIDVLKPKDYYNDKIGLKLAFDISRFIEFLNAYEIIDKSIKPVVLHYSIIYLFDFISSCFIKYSTSNRGHGLTFNGNENSIVLRKFGIFPRIIDSLHLIGYPSIFSNTNDQTLENSGIEYHIPNVDSDYNDLINNINLILKGRYGYFNEPKIELRQIIDIYNKLYSLYQINNHYVKKSNFIFIDYLFLFAASSISRYRAEDWHKIQTDKNSVVRHHFEIAQFNFIYKWIPYLICEIILPEEVLYELKI